MGWTALEEKTLVDNYETKTIMELMELLPGKTADGINDKIKRLKKKGVLKAKDEEAIKRAYRQRRKNDSL